MKEKLLKKQHRQALLLENFLDVDGFGAGRSLRNRKAVTYTFGMGSTIFVSYQNSCTYPLTMHYRCR